MKELESKPRQVLEAKKSQQEVEKFKFIGKLHPKPNQRCFQINLETGEVKEVEYMYEDKTVNYLDYVKNKTTPRNKGVLIQKGFDYVIKLNLENAQKYFNNKYGKL